MTNKELLIKKIDLENQWLPLLTNKRYSNEALGLPKHISRKQAINESLDSLIAFRNQLKQLDSE